MVMDLLINFVLFGSAFIGFIIIFLRVNELNESNHIMKEWDIGRERANTFVLRWGIYTFPHGKLIKLKKTLIEKEATKNEFIKLRDDLLSQYESGTSESVFIK